MSRPTARSRIRDARRRRAAEGWPYCEHDGAPRIIATAADHVQAIRRSGHPAAAVAQYTRAIEMAAANSGPEDLIGVCPDCLCVTWRDAPPHS